MTGIRGIGTALPPKTITQDEAAVMARMFAGGSRPALEQMYKHSAVARRASVVLGPEPFFLPPEADSDFGPRTGARMALYEREAPLLAERASASALLESSIKPKRITHLVTVSCTGFSAPGFDVALIKRLGLSLSASRTHVGFMGCHGALNGLRAASAFVNADPKARVLLCAVELCSLHFRYGPRMDQLVANALFADGAAAAVVAPGAGAWKLAASGSCIFPDSEQDMAWIVRDHGFEMTLSVRVPELIRTGLKPWLTRWLKANELSLKDVRSWAVHPGGPRILQAVDDALGLPPEALAVSRKVLADCGNMSSPTVLFILDRLRKLKAKGPCVALGFGPGLTVEGALLE